MDNTFVAVVLASSMACVVTTVGIFLISRYEEWGRRNTVYFMNFFACPDNGKRYDIFGPSHAEQVALQLGVSFLGRLPIDPEIAKLCDVGQVESCPAEAFEPIALHLEERALAARPPAFATP